MTKYQVFKKVDPDSPSEAFVSLGVFEAHDPQGAVSAAIVVNDALAKVASETTFAATPAGSWKELTPQRVDVETKVRFA